MATVGEAPQMTCTLLADIMMPLQEKTLHSGRTGWQTEHVSSEGLQ